ncbi:MAG: SMP-30/gluconolactonase/LRE family protein [Brevundimonas sp.]
MRGLAAAGAGLVLAFGAGAAAQTLEPIVTTPPEPLLIESVARDADGSLILSSIHKARLMRVGADGALIPFGPEGRQAMFGLAADPARGVLWVASSPSPFDEQTDERAELIQLDAATGAVRATFAADGPEHAWGDVAVGPDGTVFVADSKGPAMLALRPGAARPEPLALLPERGSPQGMAVSADGRWLVFADYRTGLHRIDLAEGPAARDFTASPPPALPGPEGVELRGIDGLARHGDDIIAIQNGTRAHRVLRLTLNADWSAVTAREVLIEGPPLEEPTTGFVEGDSLVFISRSQWTDFGPDGRPTSITPAPAVVSRLPLTPETRP